MHWPPSDCKFLSLQLDRTVQLCHLAYTQIYTLKPSHWLAKKVSLRYRGPSTLKVRSFRVINESISCFVSMCMYTYKNEDLVLVLQYKELSFRHRWIIHELFIIRDISVRCFFPKITIVVLMILHMFSWLRMIWILVFLVLFCCFLIQSSKGRG